MGGGAEGQAAMQNWLRGGFEMDRKGNWRLKPQVADTLQRDVTAVIAETGWQRSISRSASHQLNQGTSLDASLSAGVSRGGVGSGGRSSGAGGNIAGRAGISSTDAGVGETSVRGSIDVVNYDVRSAIAESERAASRSSSPEAAFTEELQRRVLGEKGLRNRYLEQAAEGHGVIDATAPLTSLEQRQIRNTGRFNGDRNTGWGDDDPEFRKR